MLTIEGRWQVRYEPGQFNRVHHDGVFRPRTVFIYLNDLPDDDGGETYFPRLGIKFTPTQACSPFPFCAARAACSPGKIRIRNESPQFSTSRFRKACSPTLGISIGFCCYPSRQRSTTRAYANAELWSMHARIEANGQSSEES